VEAWWVMAVLLSLGLGLGLLLRPPVANHKEKDPDQRDRQIRTRMIPPGSQS